MPLPFTPFRTRTCISSTIDLLRSPLSTQPQLSRTAKLCPNQTAALRSLSLRLDIGSAGSASLRIVFSARVSRESRQVALGIFASRVAVFWKQVSSVRDSRSHTWENEGEKRFPKGAVHFWAISRHILCNIIWAGLAIAVAVSKDTCLRRAPNNQK